MREEAAVRISLHGGDGVRSKMQVSVSVCEV